MSEVKVLQDRNDQCARAMRDWTIDKRRSGRNYPENSRLGTLLWILFIWGGLIFECLWFEWMTGWQAESLIVLALLLTVVAFVWTRHVQPG